MTTNIVSLVLMLAFMPAVAAALSPESVATSPAAVEAAPSLEETTWAGTDSDGSYAEFTFLAGGHLRQVSPAFLSKKLETREGEGYTWSQDGASVKLVMNEGDDYVVTYEGTVGDGHITGKAWNTEGDHWTWDVTPKTDVSAPAAAEPVATGPAEVIEVTLEADGRYSWRGRTWTAPELTGAIVQESHLHPISEVRLLDPHERMSVADAIRISEMAQAVGAKATFDKNGKPGTIEFVPSPDDQSLREKGDGGN